MARRPSIIRPTSLHVFLPEDIRAKLDIHLYSTVEKRVPMGAYGRFIAQLVKDYFEPKSPETLHSEKVQFAKYHAMQTLLVRLVNSNCDSQYEELQDNAEDILAGKFPS